MRPVSGARYCATTWFCWRNYNAKTPSTGRFDDPGRSPASKDRLLLVKNESEMEFLKIDGKVSEQKNMSAIFFLFHPFPQQELTKFLALPPLKEGAGNSPGRAKGLCQPLHKIMCRGRYSGGPNRCLCTK